MSRITRVSCLSIVGALFASGAWAENLACDAVWSGVQEAAIASGVTGVVDTMDEGDIGTVLVGDNGILSCQDLYYILEGLNSRYDNVQGQYDSINEELSAVMQGSVLMSGSPDGCGTTDLGTFVNTIAASLCPFPADGIMGTNKTYPVAATYENLGVYGGTINATAIYSYNLSAGQYLPHNTTTPATCLANNFCLGVNDVPFDEINDQGLTACSTLENGAYPYSAAGATANTGCYRECTVSNAGIVHATVVSGNDYYGGSENDTCVATACDNGYSVSDGACVANTITINWSGTTQAYIDANNAGTCTYGGDIRTPAGVTDVPGQNFKGWRFEVPSNNNQQ